MLKAKSDFINQKELVSTETDIFSIENWIFIHFNRDNQTKKINGFVLEMPGGLQDVVFKKIN